MNEPSDNPELDLVEAEYEAELADTERPRSQLRNFLEAYGLFLIGALAALASTIAQARALAPAGRGEVVFLTVTANLTMFIALFGLHNAHGNILGQQRTKARNVLTNSVVLSIALSTVFGVAAALIFLIVPIKVQQQTGWPLTLVALGSVSTIVLMMQLRSLAITEYNFRLSNGSMLLVPLTTLAVNVILGAMGELTVTIALLAWIGGHIAATLILLVWAARHIGFGRWDLPLARQSLKFGAKNHLSGTMQLANFRLDQLFVGGIGGDAALGIYSTAVAWAETLFYLPDVLSQVQRPDILRADKKKAAENAAHGVRLALIATAVSVALMIALAPFLVTDIFGAKYSEAVGMLRVLAIGALGIAVTKVLVSAMVSQNKPLATALPLAASLIVTIGLDIALIPEYGGMGAAIASTVAYFVGAVLIAGAFLRNFRQRLNVLVPRPSDLKPLVEFGRARLKRAD